MEHTEEKKMDGKSQISNNYMEEQKSLHPDTPKSMAKRKALVIGSDRIDNIGSNIASCLREVIGRVHEYNKDDMDISTKEGIEKLSKMSHKNSFETLVLANGATHLDWIENQPYEKIMEVMNDSLISSILASQAFVKSTIDEPGPKYIVFIGSMAYKAVLNASAPYCAAKAGLAHYAKCLAWELAPKGYNVFCVHPSNTIGTPMTEKTIQGLERYRGITRGEAEGYWGASLPKQKWLTAKNIGETVSWLVSGNADYMSGCNVDLAGGQR